MSRLTTEQVQRFAHDGYVVVEDVFDPERDLDPVIKEYDSVLDRLAAELYEEQPRFSRWDTEAPACA